MPENQPSIEDWKSLFEAAVRFKEVGCWNWMWDSDIFGVQNPKNGEIGYCCIMGKNREHYALDVYLGSEGLEVINQMQDQEFPGENPDFIFSQYCLMASFEDRKELREKDFEIIKKLGMSFRGRNAWPLFRSYLPGFFPWHLTNSEVDFLLIALQQAIDVSLRFKNNPDLLNPPDGKEENYLVRVSKNVDGTIVWEDQWLPLPPLKFQSPAQLPNPKEAAAELKGFAPEQTLWEADSFYVPNPVREDGERPYFPRQILFVDHLSGMILHFQLLQPQQDYPKAIADEFKNAVRAFKRYPKEILVSKEEMLHVLSPIASELGIKIVFAENLPEIERARESMFGFFRNP